MQKKRIKWIIIISVLVLIYIIGELSKQSNKAIDIRDIKKGTILEFIGYSIIADCDPDKKKITFLEGNRAEVYYWHKGCPNNVVSEEEMIYSYRIDKAFNWRQEYSWMRTDPDVIILENQNAGYTNGKQLLPKRIMLANVYHKDTPEHIEFCLLEQLDPAEYPLRDGVFTDAGSLYNK